MSRLKAIQKTFVVKHVVVILYISKPKKPFNFKKHNQKNELVVGNIFFFFVLKPRQ